MPRQNQLTASKKNFRGGGLAPVSFREKIKLIVFDFDGVLTDNCVLVFENGLEAVRCNRSDGLAFDLLRAAQIPALILSTEINEVVSVRARKLKLPVLQGKLDKKSSLIGYCAEQRIEMDSVMFVGNDLNDLSAMQAVGFPVCPCDAHPEIRRISRWILKKRGGDGVARELAERLLGRSFGMEYFQNAKLKKLTSDSSLSPTVNKSTP